ncbi:branched-chain amino acid transport system substrate-binding protein [Agromyces flavus]|uniref:Amino acid/amide ABC transporter substrate-binding protein, HAAT family n=1 Tax=Agromyces flavus TaxID=589382 RepID=A0A1H1PW65_9MICO|nr:branched-chain amino acid ABC transporter substrate-binding protein [Agromyces flavus]MCP2367850.1 branched-chain amino acid transport system substrate-binding protein [Agromyces flavus]GGI47310.1 branched chain amino acid ABC transporter substrate-binding protein [Agromyces flavus]SDS15344.1 amino acid/amide ABC transporter substrate-binding protein, HAAT family [Agromyces flavus]
MSHGPRRRARLLPLAAGASLLLALTGCSGGLAGGGDEGGEDGPITLGMLAPFSGSESAFGAYMQNGAQLAIDELNADGGVLGRDLELVVEDDACDATTAVAGANKLVTDGVHASVGGYCSGATLPTLPIFDEAGIPMIIPAANSNELVQGLPGVFLINGTGTQQAAAAVQYAEKIGATTVAAIDDATSYSADLAASFVEQAGEAGLDVAFEATVTPGENDYSAVATQLASEQPDLVYWTGYYQEGGLIVRQATDAGYDGTFLVGDGSVDAKFAEIAGPGYTDNVVATFTQTPDMIEGADDWIASYTELAGEAPGPYSTQSYDAVRVVAQAIEDAGSTETDDVIAAIEALDGFDTFAGPLTFTDDHTLSGGGFVIVGIDPESGAFVLEDDLQG